MTGRPDHSTARYLRYSELHEREREWRQGFEAGLREHRRLVVLGVILTLLLVLRKRIHLLGALAWATTFAVVLSPVILAALAFEVTRREHQRWGSSTRTLAMACTWAAAYCLLASVALLSWPFEVLLLVPIGMGMWAFDEHWRIRRSLRYRPPAFPREEPMRDA